MRRFSLSRSLACARTRGLPSDLARLHAGAVYVGAVASLLDKGAIAIVDMVEQRLARVHDQACA
jgi:hypothetical protein